MADNPSSMLGIGTNQKYKYNDKDYSYREFYYL